MKTHKLPTYQQITTNETKVSFKAHFTPSRQTRVSQNAQFTITHAHRTKHKIYTTYITVCHDE